MAPRGLLSSIADEAYGALKTYDRRRRQQWQDGADLAQSGFEGEGERYPGSNVVSLGKMLLGGTGAALSPLTGLIPTGEELADRARRSGRGTFSQSIGRALGDLPSIIDPQLAAGGVMAAVTPAALKAVKAAEKAGKVAKKVKDLPAMPEMGDRYPGLGEEITKHDKKTGKSYLSRERSAEAREVEKRIKMAQDEIDSGDERYKPFFDRASRFDADASMYAPIEDTSKIALAKKEATRASRDKITQNPAIVKKALDAYAIGVKNAAANQDWYMMGQLQEFAMDNFGREEGAKLFEDHFAKAMAATTSGMNPTANLRMAAWANMQKEAGKPVQVATRNLPYPISAGKFGASNNLKEYDERLVRGSDFDPAENTKRYDFSGSFKGNKGAPVLDDQMMTGLFNIQTPPPGTAGHYQYPVREAARQLGVDPRKAQETMWAGFKGEDGMPMIESFNRSVYRTSRVTGQSPQEIVKRYLKGKQPMYSIGPLGLLGMQQDEDN